jgi:hypothetical protein
MTEGLKMDLLKTALREMETEKSDWSFSRAWTLLLIGMAKLDVLNVDEDDLRKVIDFLVAVEGGNSEDYYDIWKDIVGHAKVGEL